VRDYLAEARRIIAAAKRERFPADGAQPLEPRLEQLRWFVLPGDLRLPPVETPPAR
jgi:hypothetical protein